MISSRRIGRRLAAAFLAASTGLGLAVVAGGGVAQAGVPQAWGFALVENPSGPVVASHWAESVPSPVPTASPGLPGQETVIFPKIGHFKGGVVHATAVTDRLAWCQAQQWHPSGGAEIVRIRCYRKGGVPVFVPFTVTFAASSGTLPGGLAYAYVHDTGTAVASAFNSAGGPDTVTAAGPGNWVVRLHGPGPASLSGGVQVTAVDPAGPAICDVAAWAPGASQQVIRVRCYSAAGLPMTSGWDLTYQRGRAVTGAKPKFFGYTFNNKPLIAGPYAPAPPAVNFNSASGTDTITRSGTGESLVRFPLVGFLPDTVLVTAVAAGPKVCNLNTVWATGGGTAIVRDVVCYQPTGPMAPTRSLISLTGR
jgi:hypothetical protein